MLVAAFMILLVGYLGETSDTYGKAEPELKFNLKVYGDTTVFYEGPSTDLYENIKIHYRDVAKSQRADALEVPSAYDGE